MKWNVIFFKLTNFPSKSKTLGTTLAIKDNIFFYKRCVIIIIKIYCLKGNCDFLIIVFYNHYGKMYLSLALHNEKINNRLQRLGIAVDKNISFCADFIHVN
jgi:hypothetical protein